MKLRTLRNITDVSREILETSYYIFILIGMVACLIFFMACCVMNELPKEEIVVKEVTEVKTVMETEVKTIEKEKSVYKIEEQFRQLRNYSIHINNYKWNDGKLSIKVRYNYDDLVELSSFEELEAFLDKEIENPIVEKFNALRNEYNELDAL